MAADTTHSYFHRGGSTPLLGEPIHEHFRRVAARFPRNEAIVSLPQQQRLTYKELSGRVDELARGLIGIGFGKGDRIGIWSTNNVEWLLLQLATARAGIILVDINPAYRAAELKYVLQKSDVQGIFAIPSFRSADYVASLRELIPELDSADPAALSSAQLPAMRRVVVYDPVGALDTVRSAPGFTTWQEVIAAADAVDVEQMDAISASLDMDDAINIQYTSGTTGFSKAVVLSHHNLLNNAFFAAQEMRFGEHDRLCVPVPFFHCFGMVLANLMCLSVGACIVLPAESFEALSVLRAVEQERCTALHGVPTMFTAELEHPERIDIDLSSLRTGIMAGAPCPPALMNRVMRDLHCPEILIGYGQTEASPLTHITSPTDTVERRVETVGRNLPHQEVKIVDTETGQIVAHGEAGEICFRGYHVMQGYYGDAKATAETVDANGWLHSGDLGCMDAEGYVRITGRLKDMIIRGGENLYPSEIEAVILNHPKVAQVSVFGIPDEYYGEQVMAWIQLHAGETVNTDEIRDFCREHMAHFKAPKYISIVNEFPMTVTGKLQKFKMQEIAVAQIKNQERK
ncbi:MAG: AMP-binding protein [Gammaproteobacteria bacterium]|nr:AMP-binding protein [Gammaproteobacteria bacterium]